jgi:hypothetical protein
MDPLVATALTEWEKRFGISFWRGCEMAVPKDLKLNNWTAHMVRLPGWWLKNNLEKYDFVNGFRMTSHI